jgi:hypothetical protein
MVCCGWTPARAAQAMRGPTRQPHEPQLPAHPFALVLGSSGPGQAQATSRQASLVPGSPGPGQAQATQASLVPGSPGPGQAQATSRQASLVPGSPGPRQAETDRSPFGLLWLEGCENMLISFGTDVATNVFFGPRVNQACHIFCLLGDHP